MYWWGWIDVVKKIKDYRDNEMRMLREENERLKMKLMLSRGRDDDECLYD